MSGEMRGARCPFSYRVGYVNKLPRDVCVVLRSGIAMEIPRETEFHPQFEFIVTVDIELSHTLRPKFEEFLSKVGEHSSNELKFIREEYIRCRKYSAHGFITMKLEYPLSLDALKAHGGSVYLYEVDTVVSLGTQATAALHPFSDQGLHARMALESGLLGDDKKFAIQFEIVDNAGLIGDRFINVLGHVYRIQPKKDPTRKDGVFQVGNNPALTGSTQSEILSIYSPIEEADERFKLYRSFEAARDLGDEGTRQKREAAEIERGLLELKAEIARERSKLDLDSIELEKERQRQQLEYEEQQRLISKRREEDKFTAESNRMYQKDFYEDRSNRRKDESETVKHLPAIILGVGAIFMALSKFFALK